MITMILITFKIIHLDRLSISSTAIIPGMTFYSIVKTVIWISNLCGYSPFDVPPHRYSPSAYSSLFWKFCLKPTLIDTCASRLWKRLPRSCPVVFIPLQNLHCIQCRVDLKRKERWKSEPKCWMPLIFLLYFLDSHCFITSLSPLICDI